MYARSSTFLARPTSIDEGIAFVKDEVMPAAMALDGFVGLSMICDRDSGGCIATSAWSSEDAMIDSDDAMQPLRRRGGDILGSEPTVDRWEIAVLHRHAMSGEGACVRCTWLSMPSSELAHAIDTYRMATLPRMEEMDGFCSASLMVDRDSGLGVSTTTFTGRDTMVASRATADALRSRIAAEVGGTVTDVHEYELALAHLHVPEMA